MIEVNGLTKSYADLRRGRFVALDGLTFRALPGQIYGLLGPNGAGKTTALRILSTVLRPTTGTARVNGYDVVVEASQVRRQIGFISANTGIYDRLTAWEMVEYFGRLHGLPPAELTERMESIFEKLKMNDIRDLLGAKMSTGMRQKVSIARAIVHDPPVLIFDEATAGLDVLVARALLNRVAELRSGGKCIIFSTHIMREAEKLCDRVAIMHRGHILAEGTLEQLRAENGESDLEEIFFQLISRHEQHSGAAAAHDEDLIGAIMNFTNVKLIFAREVRDQLRDRRTLFMIFVLPILLYPLLGTAFFKMIQFRRNSMTVLVVGGGQLASAPAPLIEGDGFAPQLFPDGSDGADLLKVQMAPDGSPGTGDPSAEAVAEAGRQVQAKAFDAAVVFPPDFAARLAAYRNAIQHDFAGVPALAGKEREKPAKADSLSIIEKRPAELPRPKIIYNSAHDRSAVAFGRLSAVLDRWTEEIGKTNLVAGGMPAEAVRPFEVDSSNLAGELASKTDNVWPRLLPIMLLLWAMTGAFYPAVDLCAGEKERGTLETLLSSPAERSDIVVGKLLTIMSFSMITAILNLLCVGMTAFLVLRQIDSVGGPPLLAAVWLALALVPVSALFSALCLALASFARSTKEGQYYLMPLLMLSLPMAVLPMSPGVELNLGNSLIPISGLVLLLKTLLEGSYVQALQYLPIVLAVTLAACWLAVRWAVEQFNKESVIFRESERFAVGLWLRRLMRDRASTPSAAESLFCGVVILVLSFLMQTAAGGLSDFSGFARVTLVLQLAAIFTPAVLMALVLTSSPRQTLLLRLPRWRMVPAAAVLAVALHPFIIALNALVMHLYPMGPEMVQAVEKLQNQFASADLGLLLLCVAVTPAICEELAFRGFILSGLCNRGSGRNLGNDWRAIVVSAIFFGAAHAFLQQSINACLLGIVLGFLAVRSGSLLPGVVFHFLHNAMTVLSAKVTPELLDRVSGLGFLVQPTAGGPAYQWPVYLFGGVTSLALLGWFACHRSVTKKTAEARSPEEVLQRVFEKEESSDDESSDDESSDDEADGGREELQIGNCSAT